MKKREYVKKLSQTIINRVTLHAPILYDNKVDLKSLSDYSIDEKLPIFKFEKDLNKYLLKAFICSQKGVNYNLVLTNKNIKKGYQKKLNKLKNVYVIDPEFTPLKTLETINKLNINYYSNINFKECLNTNYFSIFGEIVNLNFNNFSLAKNEEKNGIFYDLKMFVLNGQNYYFSAINKQNFEKEIEFEINIPLKKGYYFFKKLSNCIKIDNILTKERLFFNFSTNYANISFSHIDGLENSTMACVNLRVKTKIKPKSKKVFFFNLGDNKFTLKSQNLMDKFFQISNQKLNEIFDLKIKTNHSDFDYDFNVTMPRKIIANWLNFNRNEELESKYFELKNSFFEERNNQIYIKKNFNYKLKELGIFNGEFYKKILIYQGDEKLLQIGHTKFFNINCFSKKAIKKNEAISLCFG